MSKYWTIPFLFIAGALPALADIPSALEPSYSEAVLSYNSKDYTKAVSLLDGLIAKDAKVYEFLELKALSLKMMKDPEHAAEAYQALIAAKTAENRPEREIAAYHFELGQLYFEKNDLNHARESFTYSMKAGFNSSPSHFFLGMVNYRAKSFTQAESEFREVVRGDVDDLKPSAHFYIGQIGLQTGYAGGATQSFFAARSTAKEQIDGKETPAESKKMAQTVFEQADASLKPFNRDKMFGSVTLITGYDSNVLSVPSSQSSTASGGTGQGSVKETLQAGLGYMTSPMNTYQWVPSYRTSYNMNFNKDVRNGQFMTHDLSLYVTRNALAASSWGMKFAGNYTFQTQVDAETDAGKLHPYSLGGSFGPYYRKELDRKLVFGAELVAQPVKNYLDADLSDDTYKRSGLDMVAKVSLKNEKGDRWWNPGVAVSYDLNSTTGSEYNSRALIIGVTNSLKFTDATGVAMSVDFSPISYNKRLGESRSDKMLSIDTSLSQKMSEKYSLVADVQFINNSSNLADLYQYKRLVVSAGLGYSL